MNSLPPGMKTYSEVFWQIMILKVDFMKRLGIFFMIITFAFAFFSCSSSKNISSAQTSGIIIESSSTKAETVVVVPNNVVPNKNEPLQEKYALYLNVPPSQIQNIRLYQFIDYWMYTPYKWGGTDKTGIDCSAFMQRLLKEVYDIKMPRTSITQFFDKWVDLFDSKRYLAEGDLVFFRTMEDKVVSHVGLYLGNRMFINASSSKGVVIANLDDPYWKNRYVAAGRVKAILLNR
jgi:cell wall-associated NlpC family hydrolase